MQRELFPDSLTLSDPFRRQAMHIERGHGVWSLYTSSRPRANEDEREEISIRVVYTNEWYKFEKTGNRWEVAVVHHIFGRKTVETGWGKSRRQRREVTYRCRISEWSFPTRNEAVDFADRLVGILKERERKRNESDD